MVTFHVARVPSSAASTLPSAIRARMREPDPVEHVVERHPQAVDGEGVPHQRTQERQRQEPVGDGRAERPFGPDALRIDMDPLMVGGGVRKRVDAVLRDQEPVADRDLAPDQPAELRQVDDGHAALPWKPRPSPASLSSNGDGCQ
jgi:hypothetical protein